MNKKSFYFLVLLMLRAIIILGQKPYLVKDIVAGNSKSTPEKFLEVNGELFFVADYLEDQFSQRELYKTDGTTEGTTMVKRIYADPLLSNTSSRVDNLTKVNNLLFFSAQDILHGEELWKSDGTENGTVLVKDISPTGTNDSSPNNFCDVNGTLFFSAKDGVLGYELWKSDGTLEGTNLVKDIKIEAPNNCCGSTPVSLINYNGILFFLANDGIHGQELWRSDGSEIGTFMVKDIGVTQSNHIGNLLIFNNLLYFTADDGIHGQEIWRSDGTEAGTFMVFDIREGNFDNFDIENLISLNNKLFFKGFDQIYGHELWVSDGQTIQNTKIVKNIAPGSFDSGITKLTPIDDFVYFSADDRVHGQEIWKSDGTDIGTYMVSDIAIGSIASFPSSYVKFNNEIFFWARSLNFSPEFWKIDINGIPTKLGNVALALDRVIVFNNKLIFNGSVTINNSYFEQELWTIGNCNNLLLKLPITNKSEVFNFEVQSNSSLQTCHCDIFNNLISTFEATGNNPIDALNTSSRVFNDKIQSNYFAKRHYEITPQINPNTSTGKVTTYFLQNEFDSYNSLKSIDLPTNSTDSQGKANLRIYKYTGISSDGSGFPNTYSGLPTIINPADEDIIWNATAQRWEVTFDTVGFGGFFIRSGSICTTTKSGDWNDPTVWSCGVVPTNLDDVIISSTHIISMPDNYTGQANNIENNGNLIFGQNAVLNLTGQWYFFNRKKLLFHRQAPP